MEKEIIYIGDPMCSWCYGFTDIIQTIKEKYKDRAKVTLVMGGLRPDGTHVVDDDYRNFLKEHWTEISMRTGQPFDLSILDSTGWIYDTEKPCRAVVVMRRMKPEVEWEYFAATQKAFYHMNHNPNDPESFARIAATFGIDEQTFLHAYSDETNIEATQQDFNWAKKAGVSGFPTVLLSDEQGLSALTVGYRSLSSLEQVLDKWIEN